MNDKASEIISRDFSHLSSKALLLVNDLVKEKLRLLNLLPLEWRRVEGASSLPGHTLTFRGLFGRVHHFCRVTQGDTVSYGYLEEGEPGCRALSMENWSVEIHNSSYDVLVGDDRRARLQPLRGGQLRGAAVPCDLGRGAHLARGSPNVKKIVHPVFQHISHLWYILMMTHCVGTSNSGGILIFFTFLF